VGTFETQCVCASMADIQSATAQIRRGKKIDGRRNHRTKI